MPHPKDTLCYYSTNPWVKWYICKTWRNDRHYVWCGPYFDPQNNGPDHVGRLIPPTSSPAAIYRDLAHAVKGAFDKHNAKITTQRSSLLGLIETWREAGELSEEDATEAISYVSSDEPSVWRPLLYVIPVLGISEERVFRVPATQRAGLGPEYLIKDLAGNEFERISFDVS